MDNKESSPILLGLTGHLRIKRSKSENSLIPLSNLNGAAVKILGPHKTVADTFKVQTRTGLSFFVQAKFLHNFGWPQMQSAQTLLSNVLQNNSKESPVHIIAAEQGYIVLLKYLIDCKAITHSEIEQAIAVAKVYGQQEVVDALENHGWNEYQTLAYKSQWEELITALWRALWSEKHTPSINLNLLDPTGFSILHRAFRDNRCSSLTCRFLLQYFEVDLEHKVNDCSR